MKEGFAMELSDRIEELWQEVSGLLRSRGSRVEFMDSELWLVEPELMEEILSRVGEAEDLCRRSGEREEVCSGIFRDRLKLINPPSPDGEENTAAVFRTYGRKTPLILTDPEKVEMELGHYFSVWRNMKRKALREELERGEGDYTREEADRMRSETEREIAEAEAAVEEISRNFGDYEVFITKYRHAREYPTLYYRTPEGRRRTEALRIGGVANVLAYAPEGKGKRRDSRIERMMEEFNEAGDWIFYRKRRDRRG